MVFLLQFISVSLVLDLKHGSDACASLTALPRALTSKFWWVVCHLRCSQGWAGDIQPADWTISLCDMCWYSKCCWHRQWYVRVCIREACRVLSLTASLNNGFDSNQNFSLYQVNSNIFLSMFEFSLPRTYGTFFIPSFCPL